MRSLVVSCACLVLVAGLAEASDNDFRFVVLSDIHVGSNDANYLAKYNTIVNEIKAMPEKPAAVFITGDITDSGYESGTFNEVGGGSQTPNQITNFKNWFKNPLEAAGIPVYMVLGNHDANHQSTASQFAATMGIPLYQSIDIQDTHFILTSGVPDNAQGPYGTKGGSTWGIGQAGQIDSEQLVWIEDDLKSQANQDAKLSIMMNHFPLFSNDAGGYQIQNTDWFGNVTNSGDSLRSWVAEYGVDAYLYGHRHTNYGANFHDGQTIVSSLASLPQDMDTVFDPTIFTAEDGQIVTAMMDKMCAGTVYQGPTKTSGIGYDVFDVDGYTLSHYRKLISGTYQGELIGPQQEWTLVAVPEPTSIGLMMLAGLAMLRRRRTA